MILPQKDITTEGGVATGTRKFVEFFGRPAVLYIKIEGVIDVPAVKKLVDDGLIAAIKYAIVRDDPAEDDYLERLVDAVDPNLIVSGIGEQPAITHLRKFGLNGFTSGCVCVNPQKSADMLAALKVGDDATAEDIRRFFKPLEDLRNEIHPIRVLHEAVRLAGIADTGPITPLLSNLDAADHERVGAAAKSLLA
jgi:dihydrodipicolinate synthase/N-acetylneuraminate lyase